jgi:hypothetical protein
MLNLPGQVMPIDLAAAWIQITNSNETRLQLLNEMRMYRPLRMDGHVRPDPHPTVDYEACVLTEEWWEANVGTVQLFRGATLARARGNSWTPSPKWAAYFSDLRAGEYPGDQFGIFTTTMNWTTATRASLRLLVTTDQGEGFTEYVFLDPRALEVTNL